MNRLSENIAEAERALTEKPMLATSAERILILNEIKSNYNDLPQPLRFAHTLSELLGRVSVPLEKFDLIAGRCVDRELTEAEEAVFQSYIRHPDYAARSTFLGSGHCTYSWEMVVELGLPGMRDAAQKELDSHSEPAKRDFLSAIIMIYDALTAYMLRYAEAAEALGMIGVADALRDGALNRPSTFRSALQLLWIITLVDCSYITENPTLTVGRLDKILYPLYKADLEKGILTCDEAAELVTDYYCKHNLNMGRGEHQVGDETNSTTFKRICNFDAPQYLLLAGTDENGQPVVNELTQIFAECIQPSFKNPVVVVLYFKDMNTLHPELWKTLVEKGLQSASLMFYNDNNMLQTFQRIGIPIEDCWNYAHFGCNWPSTGDNCAWMQGGPRAPAFHAETSKEELSPIFQPYMRVNAAHGWPEDLMIVLRKLAEREDEGITIEDVYEGFFARMSDMIDRKLKLYSLDLSIRRRKPAAVLTFGDCFFRDSIRNAGCFAANAKYHFELQAFQMFATVADSFIAVDKLVMKEHRMTLKHLLQAIDANFEGYETELALCRNADKYGMDTPLSNLHARRLSETASRLVIEKNRPYLEREGLFLVPCIQSDTWHLKYGEQFGATPDGRLANTPYSQNTRPSNGSCTNGLTAMFNALLNHPTDGWLSGALNLDVDPKQFEGEAGQKRFGAMLAVYFNRGGLHAQITSASADDLIDAQINPHLHRDLRVRVTGYSGVFVDICKRLQDDIIGRLS